MKPKEKALSLCQKIGITTLFADDCNDGATLPLRISKMCAIIAVDEILLVLFQSHEIDYWKEVKQEIENL